jgi:preprotein translocase subunit YajC
MKAMDDRLRIGDMVTVPGGHVGQVENIRHGMYLIAHSRGPKTGFDVIKNRTRRWYSRDEIEPTDAPPDIATIER